MLGSDGSAPPRNPSLLSGGGWADAWEAVLFCCLAGKECAKPPLSYPEALSGLLSGPLAGLLWDSWGSAAFPLHLGLRPVPKEILL